VFSSQDWLTDMEITYTQGPMNLNWKQIMATISGDDRFYMNTEEDEVTEKEAGWEFLRMYGNEDDDDDDDDEDDSEFSEAAVEEEEELVRVIAALLYPVLQMELYLTFLSFVFRQEEDENMDESEFEEESEEESDFDADEDLEEQGMDWDDMEREAAADDRRKRQSGDDDGADRRGKQKKRRR